MKCRNSLKKSRWVVLATIVVAFLILMPTSQSESSLTKWTAQQGQEIPLGNNLKLVVGKIENDKVEITVQGASAIPVMQRESPGADAREAKEAKERCNDCCRKQGKEPNN